MLAHPALLMQQHPAAKSNPLVPTLLTSFIYTLVISILFLRVKVQL
jgi:hypothetical protein